MNTFPPGEFNNQIFLDSLGLKWIYSSSSNSWTNDGHVESFPIATKNISGLLSKEYKSLLDSISYQGGGYAIIIDPSVTKRTLDNPDGVIFGDVELVSESLDIQCVGGSNKQLIQEQCTRPVYLETDVSPPGFDINFSSKFLSTFCVNIPGGPGPIGETGDPGEDGDDGTGDGPQGLQGNIGKDAAAHIPLAGVKINDVNNIFDTAVIGLDLDQANGQLLVTKAKVKTNTSQIADQFITNQISRSIQFIGNCFDYNIVNQDQGISCGGNNVFDVSNPIIAYYPSQFNADSFTVGNTFQVVRKRLSDLIDSIIAFYEEQLLSISNKYDQQINTFIVSKDAEARGMLDALATQLAECENITYLDYCIGLSASNCVSPAKPVAPTVTECSSLVALANCPNGGDCNVISNFGFIPQFNPVFSFIAPAPINIGYDQTVNNNPNGIYKITSFSEDQISNYLNILSQVLTTDVNYSNAQIAINNLNNNFSSSYLSSVIFKEWCDSLIFNLRSGTTFYPKQQVFNNSLSQFPVGTYYFQYAGGTLTQPMLNSVELPNNNKNSQSLINGSFQNYWVGGEIPVCPGLFFSNPFDDSKIPVDFSFINTSYGLEIGVLSAVNNFNNLPSDYFNSHEYDINASIGTALNKSKKWIDYINNQNTAVKEENNITWIDFARPVNTNFADQNAVQSAYLNGPLNSQIVSIILTKPSFLFIRAKSAYSLLDKNGIFEMPPDIGDSSINNVQLLMNVDGSYVPPVLNTRSTPIGSVNIKVQSVICAAGTVPTTPAPVSPSQIYIYDIAKNPPKFIFSKQGTPNSTFIGFTIGTKVVVTASSAVDFTQIKVPANSPISLDWLYGVNGVGTIGGNALNGQIAVPKDPSISYILTPGSAVDWTFKVANNSLNTPRGFIDHYFTNEYGPTSASSDQFVVNGLLIPVVGNFFASLKTYGLQVDGAGTDTLHIYGVWDANKLLNQHYHNIGKSGSVSGFMTLYYTAPPSSGVAPGSYGPQLLEFLMPVVVVIV